MGPSPNPNLKLSEQFYFKGIKKVTNIKSYLNFLLFFKGSELGWGLTGYDLIE